MPQNFHYPPILSLISEPRLASYNMTFAPSTDSELYGIYIWAQHVVGALYPILQHIEISLQNAIDAEARQRFGEFYWRLPQFNTPKTIDFSNNLRKAESKLNAQWRTLEHRRRGLISGTSAWSHDKIVAATDFSTWEYVLRDDFSAQDRTQEPHCLWPRSMSKIFRQYHAIDPSNLLARRKILDLVHEIREYRNRLFHHDKIWISSTGVVNAHTAIDSIRKKINRMELLIKAIDQRLLNILEKVGVFACARRTCSINELNIYRYAHTEAPLTARKKRILRSLAAQVKAENSTAVWTYGGSLYGLYKIR